MKEIYYKYSFCLMLISVCIGLCSCSNPYSKFDGEWEYRESDNTVTRMEINFDKKLLISYKTQAGIGRVVHAFQYPVVQIENRENQLGIATYTDLYIFKPAGNDALLMRRGKLNGNDPQAALTNFLADNDGKIFDLSRPKKENDKWLPRVELAINRLGGNWYSEKDRKKPALNIDLKNGNVSFSAPALYQLNGSAEAKILYYNETIKIDPKFGHIDHAYFHFAKDISGKRISISTKTKPNELYYLGGTDKSTSSGPYFPEMSTDDWQAFISAQNEEKLAEAWMRRRKGREEILAQKKKIEDDIKAKAERIEKMPQFFFGGIGLADSPAVMVKKGRGDYNVATTFPVQQSGHEIGSIKDAKLSYRKFFLENPILDEFFHYHEPEKGALQIQTEFNLSLSKLVQAAGVRVDKVNLTEKERNEKGKTQISGTYFTLPGELPQMLMLDIWGDIVPSAQEVFTERYGEPDVITSTRGIKTVIWRSKNELAVMIMSDRLVADHSNDMMTIYSLDGYNKLYSFERQLLDREKERQELNQKREEERKKAFENQRKSKI